MITKLIFSGNFVECVKCKDVDSFRNYSKAEYQAELDLFPVSVDNLNKFSSNDSIVRSRTRLRRLLYSNFGRFIRNGSPVPAQFVTFTFEDNIEDVKLANKEFSLFIQRLAYRLGVKRSSIAYISVPERQERGAIHYHVIFFNLPYISSSDLNAWYFQIWGKGFVYRETVKVDFEVSRLVGYLLKYLTKGKEFFYNQKRFFSSRACFRPIVISASLSYHYIMSLYRGTSFHKHTNSFDCAFIGQVDYDVFMLPDDYLLSFLNRECGFDISKYYGQVLE